MFSLYTTEDKLNDICLEESDWWDIIKDQQYVCISANNGDTWDSSNRVLANLHKIGVEIDINNDLVDDIKQDHSKVFELPNPYYIIDIDKETAAKIQNQYGVICRTLEEANINPLTKNGWIIDTSDTRKPQGWKAFFDGIDVPLNSIVIVDRYFFSSEENETIDDSFYNLRTIFDSILPKKCRDNVIHIAIIFDSSTLKDRDGCDFSKLVTKANQIKKNLRDYHINVELISIDNNCYKYADTHDRFILSNYFTVKADHKLKAFHSDNSHTCCQNLIFNYLYSTGIGDDKKSSTPEFTQDRILQAIFESINTSKNGIMHGFNGQTSKKGEFSVKNRFFL